METEQVTLKDIYALFAKVTTAQAEVTAAQAEVTVVYKEIGKKIKEVVAVQKATAEQMKASTKKSDKLKAEIAALDKRLKAEMVAFDKKLKAERDALDKKRKADDDRRRVKEDKRSAKIDEQIADLVRSTREHGSYINNAAVRTEQYFQNAIENNKYRIGTIQFTELQRNTRRKSSQAEVEFDGILFNGTDAGILEIKTTLHLNDIIKIVSKIEKFRTLFREYADKNVVVIVAGEVIHKNAAEAAYAHGFILLEPDGETMKVNDSRVKRY